MDYSFLYNKRKDVPLLRGRIYMINLFTYPLFASLVYKRQLDLLTKLSFGVYFIGCYFSAIASAMYHNNRCLVFDRTVYKRIDYAGVYWSNLCGSFPVLMHYINSDLDVILVVVHISINSYGIFSSLCLNFINTCKLFRIIIYWLSHFFNNICLYYLYKDKLYMEIFLYVVGYMVFLYGAIVYTREKPNLFPGVFEFHELAHLLLVIGSLFVFTFNVLVTGVFKSNYI